jgi:A/G-specific adenine glycosylase
MVRRTGRSASLLSLNDWRQLRTWYRKHGRSLPWRHHASPWSILLAETLLHRTGADVVQTLYPLARKWFPSPKTVVLKKTRWTKLLHKAGLFWRARTFVSACESLVNHHRGNVPSDRRNPELVFTAPCRTSDGVYCPSFKADH